MKTTLELPDALLIEAKTAAARRRTTLRALVESALRREIFSAQTPSKDASFIEHGPNELPCLKARGAKVTSKMVYQMLEAEGC
ncbi:MAG: DUF2191 domain-containing protein [Verrucomicrobiota bacterium]